MNKSKKLSLHYWALAGFIALGAILRFWNLDLKPLWLDEVLTALLSLGGRYEDVPLDVVFPASTLQHLFTLKPEVSCSEIAQAVATKSTHPPLFFCLMHQWLNWVEPIAQPLSWKLRALPALVGVFAIASTYLLNRVAFSPTAGLMGAAFMAVSPFGIYLSQEARHYTLPMLFITLALLGLIQIQQTLSTQKLPRPAIWLLWGIVNSIGCYIHYFFFLAFIAQLLTLTGFMYWRRRMLPRGSWVAVALVVIGVALSYLPWLPVMLESFGRSETGWLPKPANLAPVYQTLAAWVSIVITLPVEGQPIWIQVSMVLLTIAFWCWVGWQVWGGLQQLWRQPSTQVATFTLSCFTLSVLLQFVAIIYLLGKDITIAPRYNFVYYPAMCALLGASFAYRDRLSTFVRAQKPAPVQTLLGRFIFCKSLKGQWRKNFPLFIALISCIFVVSNLVFLKPFHPQKVAGDMNFEPAIPMMMVVGYTNFQDVALGLSFALAINQQNLNIPKRTTDTFFAFLNTKQGYQPVWQKLSELTASLVPRLNLWVVAPGLKQRDYPPQLAIASSRTPPNIANQKTCTLDPSGYHRIGVPYQLYRCTSAPRL